jgi:uncharacterized protein (TIGR00251 family)
VSSASTHRANWYRWDGPDLVLQVFVQPRASRAEFAEAGERGLKIRLPAPPVDGAANAALQAFLAEEFGVPKKEVVLEQGETARRKRIRIRSPRRLPAGLALQKT